MNYNDLMLWRHLEVMVSNGNHPQMAELFSYFQVSELLQFSQMDILCIQYYYH